MVVDIYLVVINDYDTYELGFQGSSGRELAAVLEILSSMIEIHNDRNMI